MSIKNELELEGMKKVSEAVALTLREMVAYTKPGMTTKQIDDYGAAILHKLGARSAPNLAYRFPGATCISVNNEFCHGIPSGRIVEEGDLINIDVSAELDGFWSDNGNSFVLGQDIHQHQNLVNASKDILYLAIHAIRDGVRISDVGGLMESEAKSRGFKVLRNLAGHGVGRSLHEKPEAIVNFKERFNRRKFEKNSVVAIETFITTTSSQAVMLEDGWTLVGNRGGFMAQHEHTIVVTENEPIILTEKNGVWN